MHRDTRSLLRLLLIWAIAAAAFWGLYARFHGVYESLFHHEPHAAHATAVPAGEATAAATETPAPAAAAPAAPTAEELREHELHVNLWRTVVLYLAIFFSVGTLLAALISALNLGRYESERGASVDAAHAHH